MSRVIAILLCSIAFTGCASKGFNRGALEEQIGVKKQVVDDAQIKEILNKKSNLPKPFKLAVYFKRPTSLQWRWSDTDKDLVLTASKELKDQKIISDVYTILPSLVSEEDVHSIRLAAARLGANAVLIVEGAGQLDRYINNYGWSYILIVPTLFVRGSEADSLFMTSASMWDVGNEYLYLTAEAEGKAHTSYVAAFGPKDEELFENAKTPALQNLKTQIVEMVKGVKK